jgi:hypothetical protein
LEVDVASIKILDSYDDANIYFESTNNNNIEKQSFLIKYYNAVDDDSNGILSGLSLMLNLIIKNRPFYFEVPRPIKLLNSNEEGKDVVFVENIDLVDQSKDKLGVRIFDWLHGETLSQCCATIELMIQMGCILGGIRISLKDFDHFSFHRIHVWDILHLEKSIFLKKYIKDEKIEIIVEKVLKILYEEVFVISKFFNYSIIMSDCNDGNTIVSKANSFLFEKKIVGLIDFSDAVYTWFYYFFFHLLMHFASH